MATKKKSRSAPTAAAGGSTGSELAATTAAIHKQYGEAMLTRGSDNAQPWRIPTSVFAFDLATCGGIPHNRISMFHGPKSSGKSSMSEKVIAGAQSTLPDQQVAHIDVEGTRDTTWSGKLGVNNDNVVYVKPEIGEQAVDITDALLRTREISLVVVDSIAAMTANKELESSAEDAHVGLQARLISSFMRKATSALIAERKRGHFVTLLVINQQRTKIGGWSPTGEPISLPGGKALEFATSLQARFKNKETISKDADGFDTVEYNEHAFALDKNKMNAGIKSGEYQLMRRDSTTYDLLEGEVDDAPTMLAHAKKIGCYTGGGKSWRLSIPDFDQTFGNAEETIIFLYQNREIYWKLRCHLIADHAARLKLPAYFINYLYGDV